MITMSDEEQKGLTGFFSRFGSAKKQTVSEEEIKDIVADNDELADDEKRMIHDIIDLGDMSVHEIMQPRVDMIMVEDTETVRTAVERMHGTGYSRLPIFHEDADHIIGIVHYKNLVGPLIDGREDDLAAKYAFEPLFVPETKDIFPLLKEMQTNRQQMAIVVDEYGGTDGLITVEDIIEEIVGEIVDEYDMEGKEITKLSDGVWRVDGRFPVEDAAALDDLNAITHRYVRAEVCARLRAWARQGGTVAAIDAIALIESGLAELCTVTIGVTAPREVRIERLIAREGVTRDYAEARIDAQKPNEWFAQHCSYVLDNGGTLADFQRRCHQLIQEVLS